jgi:hypothetical protein
MIIILDLSYLMCHCALCVSCVWHGVTVDRILHSLLINSNQIIFTQEGDKRYLMMKLKEEYKEEGL